MKERPQMRCGICIRVCVHVRACTHTHPFSVTHCRNVSTAPCGADRPSSCHRESHVSLPSVLTPGGKHSVAASWHPAGRASSCPCAATAAGERSGAALLGCVPGTGNLPCCGFLHARGRRDSLELLHPRVLKANVLEHGDRVFL